MICLFNTDFVSICKNVISEAIDYTLAIDRFWGQGREGKCSSVPLCISFTSVLGDVEF